MSTATTSKTEDATKTTEPPKEGDQTLPHLSVLEEDDEFEEFAVQGKRRTQTPPLRVIYALLSRACLLSHPPKFRLGRLSNGSSASRRGCSWSSQVRG